MEIAKMSTFTSLASSSLVYGESIAEERSMDSSEESSSWSTASVGAILNTWGVISVAL